MHPTTPCAVIYKFFFTVVYKFVLQFFLQCFTVFFTVFFTFFFTIFYKAVEWAGDFGARDLGGLALILRYLLWLRQRIRANNVHLLDHINIMQYRDGSSAAMVLCARGGYIVMTLPRWGGGEGGC